MTHEYVSVAGHTLAKDFYDRLILVGLRDRDAAVLEWMRRYAADTPQYAYAQVDKIMMTYTLLPFMED